MSCRDTAGGKAICSAMNALISDNPYFNSDDVPEILHRLKRESANATESVSQSEAINLLDRYAFWVRNKTGLQPGRKAKIFDKIAEAIKEIEAGQNIPSKALFHSWKNLPAEIDMLTEVAKFKELYPINIEEENAPAYAFTPTHKQFTDFKPELIAATQELFKNPPSKLPPEVRDLYFRDWIRSVSKAYSVETPYLDWENNSDIANFLVSTGYDKDNNTIYLDANSPTLFSLFRSMRECLVKNKAVEDENLITLSSKFLKIAPIPSDNDSIAWAHSLYYNVKPELFKKLVRQNYMIAFPAFAQAALDWPLTEEQARLEEQ